MTNKLLEEAIRCTSIQDVYMRNSNMQIADGFDPIFSQQELAVQFMQRPLKAETADLTSEDGDHFKLLRVEVIMGVRFVDADAATSTDDTTDIEDDAAQQTVKAELSSNFVAEYLITCEELSQEAINEFSQSNAGFHIWPYWREYLHTMCNRCKLPPVVMPMYQVSNNR